MPTDKEELLHCPTCWSPMEHFSLTHMSYVLYSSLLLFDSALQGRVSYESLKMFPAPSPIVLWGHYHIYLSGNRQPSYRIEICRRTLLSFLSTHLLNQLNGCQTALKYICPSSPAKMWMSYTQNMLIMYKLGNPSRLISGSWRLGKDIFVT